MQPGSDGHRRARPRGPDPASPDPRGSIPGGPGRPGRGRAASSVWEGGGGDTGRSCAALGRGQALGSWAERPSVPSAAQLGEGPGCPRGGKVPRWQKCPGTAGVGGREAGWPLLLAQAERKKSEGNRGCGGSRQHRPEQILPLPPAPPRHLPSFPLPPVGTPERGGTDGLLPRGQGETPSPPPLFLPTSISTRALTEIVRLPPLGSKSEESKRRAGKENSSSAALHPCRPGAGTRPPPARSPRPAASVSGRSGHRTRRRGQTFRRSSRHRRHRGRQRSPGREGPGSASPSSPGAPRPAGPRRERGSGEEAGGAEARAERAAARPPVDGCGAPGAGKQLCRVTRREDCRARGRGLRGASERTALPAPPALRSLRSAPLRRPPARGEDDPPVAATGGSSSVGGGESEALRCERGAPPQSPPQRSAAPRRARPAPGLRRLRSRLGQVASTGPLGTFPAPQPSLRRLRFRFIRAGTAGPRRGEDGEQAAATEAPRDARAAVTPRRPLLLTRLSGPRDPRRPFPATRKPRGPAGPLPL